MTNESQPLLVFDGAHGEEHPQNIFDGGVTLAAFVAAGGLAYTVGKDLIPRLKGNAPILLAFIDSRPDDDGQSYLTYFSVKNLTMHAIYIEAFVPVDPITLEIRNIRDPRATTISYDKPKIHDSARETPILIQSMTNSYFWISVPRKSIYDDYKRIEYGRFQIEYSEMYATKSSRTDDIHFRIRDMK